jgi:hypothetical protein
MKNDYVEMMLVEMVNIEREYTYEMMSYINSEAEFIHNCMETNSVLTEAGAGNKPGEKKPSLFARFKEIITNSFNKFIAKAKEIVSNLRPFKEKYLDKLDSITYSGLSIDIMPIWRYDTQMNTTIASIKTMINEFKSARRYTSMPEDTTKEGIIKNVREFKKYYNSEIGYAEVMKRKFTMGDNLDAYKVITIDSDSEIKSACEKGREYIQNYDSLVNKLKGMKTQFENELDAAEKESERNNNSESQTESYVPFLILENNYITDTDLVFCKGAHMLYEAENNDSNPSTVRVSNDNDDSGNNQNSGGGNSKPPANNVYITNMASIIITALATAISVAESKLVIFKKLITSVVTKSGKAPKNNNNNNQSNDTTKKENDNQSNNKAEPDKPKKKGLFRRKNK